MEETILDFNKALNELYDALPEHADDLAEGYQGASEKLLSYPESSPRTLNSVEDALSELKKAHSDKDLDLVKTNLAIKVRALRAGPSKFQCNQIHMVHTSSNLLYQSHHAPLPK